MTERRVTRRQALLAGGSGVVALALGARATRVLAPASPEAAATDLLTRSQFRPLVGRELRAATAAGATHRVMLAEIADLRRARVGDEDAFELVFHGPAELAVSSELLELRAAGGGRAHLLVSRSALPRKAGGQQYSAIINRAAGATQEV